MMAIPVRINYKVSGLLTCIIITIIYVRSPHNELQTTEQTGWSKNYGFIEQKELIDQIDLMEQKLMKVNKLEEEFKARQDLIQDQCAVLGPKADQIIKDWGEPAVRYLYLGKEGDARVCSHFKSGYSSWKTMVQTLKQVTREGNDEPVIITVRHPLVRLLSAWKDKYLGGSPLYMFDEAWREETKTIETWAKRWHRYWMLAAFSTGKIETPESLREAMKNRKNVMAAARRLNLTLDNYRNLSFTFEEFLHHINWTYENRVPNTHWIPTNVQCNLCHDKYDYILHLENSTEEVPYVMNRLGFGNKEFARSHPSHSTLENESVPKAKQKTYAEYYNEVSKDIYERIIYLYEADFDILGYPKEVP